MKYLKGFLICFCFLFLIFLAPKIKAEEKAILPKTIIEEEVVLENQEIETDTLIIGKKITIDKNTTLKKNLITIGSDVVIDGKINEYLIIFGGNVVIKGQVNKNLIVVGGNVLLEEQSVIGGYAVVTGGQVEEKGTIVGEKWIEANLSEKIMRATSSPSTKIKSTFSLVSILSKLLVLLVLVKIIGKKIIILKNEKRKNLTRNFFQGLLVYLLTPLLIITLFFTVIGIPLAIIIGTVYLLALYISPLLASIALSKWMQKIDLFNFKNDYLLVALGFLLFSAAINIPFLGGMIATLAQLWGLGFIWQLKKNY
jgi:hypothetical protein